MCLPRTLGSGPGYTVLGHAFTSLALVGMKQLSLPGCWEGQRRRGMCCRSTVDGVSVTCFCRPHCGWNEALTLSCSFPDSLIKGKPKRGRECTLGLSRHSVRWV